jgi:hypothetical protein
MLPYGTYRAKASFGLISAYHATSSIIPASLCGYALPGTPAALAKSVARLEDGSPASPVGELIDVIVKEVEARNHLDSQGATDADVQAEKDQAKERGVGAIHGLAELQGWVTLLGVTKRWIDSPTTLIA